MQIISEQNPDCAAIAASYLQQKKIISFATDTVYGIAVDASSSNAVEHLYQIKKRDKNKPITIFLPNIEIAKKIFIFDNMSHKIAEKFLTQGLTLVLKKRPYTPILLAKELNLNDDFLGFRIVKKNFINDLFMNFNGIIAVTSANISGSKDAISADEIKNNLSLLKIDLLIDGGICEKRISSTIVKIFEEKITILREGAIASNIIKTFAK